MYDAVYAKPLISLSSFIVANGCNWNTSLKISIAIFHVFHVHHNVCEFVRILSVGHGIG